MGSQGVLAEKRCSDVYDDNKMVLETELEVERIVRAFHEGQKTSKRHRAWLVGGDETSHHQFRTRMVQFARKNKVFVVYWLPYNTKRVLD